MKSNSKIEFGDFQTPPGLAGAICSFLTRRGVNPDVVLEPTCGIGAFLVTAASAFPKAKLIGWEINSDYVKEGRVRLELEGLSKRASLEQCDFFDQELGVELSKLSGSLLLLGNPPWVTNAGVSSIDGSNVPKKSNFHGLRGIAALTGKSNFDISEWMLMQLVTALRGRKATIAMLCKTATARKVLRFGWENDGRIEHAALYRIDAKSHFNASVDACLLVISTGRNGPVEAGVFETLESELPTAVLGLAGSDLVYDIRTYRRLRHLEGLCPFQWRSGVKHDCAAIMELRAQGGDHLLNKFGEEVRIESEYLFPLLKYSDLANGRIEPTRQVIVTQRRVGEDTSVIAEKAPLTWRYLESHRKQFEARKSSIYNGRIPFALFGIGDYSFSPWKVAVSGLHRTPRFVVIGPQNKKPVFFDDASYFLPFEHEAEARELLAILNSEVCKEFMTCLTFTDSKRPITVDLLQRLNIGAIAREAGLPFAQRAPHPRSSHFSGRPEVLQTELAMDASTNSLL